MKSVLLLALWCLTPNLQALPPDAQSLLNSLPEKSVTLDVVLERAVKESDSFKALKAEEMLIELPKLEAEALTFMNLTASSDYTDNQFEPTNPFSFTRQIINQYSLGLQKRFSSGTTFQSEVSHGKYFFQLPPGPFQIVPQIYQSVLSFGLSQSLLKDSFGLATRSKIEAASLASEASKLEYQDKIQAYSLDLAQVFYDAWLAKESHTAAKESFNRRARTLKVTQIRNRRGTSERPDLLQAQAAETESKLLVTDAHLNLQDKWRALVISLKLPKEWIEIDAVEIPLKISNETPKAQETCNRVKKTNEPTPSYMVEVLEKITKATELRLKAAQNEKYPAVDLVGSYAVNSVDPNDRTQTSREVWDRQFPAWSVGLKVTYPIGSPIERANHQRAMVEHVQNTTRLQEAKDQLELTWITLCERLETLNTKAKEFETSVSQQTKRERLESQRFNIGSVPLLNVIQSGDDETRTRQNLLQTKANLELTALQILAFDRKLFSRVEGFTHEKND